MKFELIQNKDLVSVLKENLRRQNVSYVNLRKYTENFDSRNGIFTNDGIDPYLVPLEEMDLELSRAKSDSLSHLIGLTSIARTKNSLTTYIPQLETDSLKIKSFETFLEELEDVASLFPNEQDVYLVSSGRGYHFYGTQLMEVGSWKNFMTEAMVDSSCVDPIFIRDSLQRGYSNLRLTTNNAKPEKPKLIGRIIQN
jgi:hypothetical protein